MWPQDHLGGGASGISTAKWEDLRQYYSDFLWDDYCFHGRDPSFCAERITKVIISGMKLYIPHTFSNYKAKKPWFKGTDLVENPKNIKKSKNNFIASLDLVLHNVCTITHHPCLNNIQIASSHSV